MTERDVLVMADRLLWKRNTSTKLVVPCCPSCNGPLTERRRTSWNAEVPAHLMDDNPDDEITAAMEG